METAHNLKRLWRRATPPLGPSLQEASEKAAGSSVGLFAFGEARQSLAGDSPACPHASLDT
ncbi:hypothetical protein amb3709 [Paramagnetospirillum magneticum AMB-1]|uniref:Uncharacterized protein n=1 Tax=Paramagnetospirillum magneticum (strain ATCC 700264 / AMB-1) TaxID=342108 RepID=Q2W0W2_PARM1|nr:hypothetical protein amb3709 [Paramagnetospirillum magneticum AMB-1]